MKYGAAMQVQIERVYGLHVSAKYVALAGIKNLIYLVWMTVRILSPRNRSGAQSVIPDEIYGLATGLT